jgi:teichuronic acid biosynthesis glycosyltransferase TuaG
LLLGAIKSYKSGMALISIVTPAYNATATLQETVDSIFAQTFQDWEWCIVDDASKDNTAQMIKDLAARDARVRPVFLEMNVGAPMALQAAIDHAQGRYIALIDADDIWLPEKLERQLAFMQKKKVPISYTGHRRMSEDGKWSGAFIHPPSRLSYHDLLKNTAMVSSSVMIDRDMVGPVHITPMKSYDLATWLPMLAKGHVAYGVDEDLMRYRVRAGSLSSNKFKTITRVWRIYRQQEKLSLPYSLYCLASYGFHAVAKRMGMGRMPWAS